MKIKNIAVIVTILSLSFTLFYQSSIIYVQSWGIPTHHYTVEVASQLVPVEWQAAFTYYSPEVIAGSGYPDQVLQDWDNHLYYPYSGEHHNAPWKINETIYVIRNFAEQQEWENVFFFLGIVSHYTADINIPVHTDEYWDGHPAYETDINNHLDDFNVSVYDFGNITDPVQFIIDCATYAHQYYWDIRNAYPTGDEYGIVTTNETIKQITEEQLGRAIGAILAIWNFTLEGITPPEISEVEDVATVMIDRAHDNDYATDALTSFTSTLDRDVVRIVYNDEEITPLTLAGVDLLVITAPFSDLGFTENETIAIANWYAAGGHLLLSGRGDYNPVNHQAINALLSAIDSHLRVNDDNVYTTSADPEYYKDWYCNTDEYGTDPVADSIRGPLNRKIQFFSPNSIYSTDNSDSVHFLIFGEEYFYQKNNDQEPPDVVFDATADNIGGTSIPLAAVEQNGTSSLALFGTTIWSDYDFGLADRDNKYLVFNTIEWLLQIDLKSNDDYQPAVFNNTETTLTDTLSTTSPTKASPYPLLVSSACLAVITILTFKKRKS